MKRNPMQHLLILLALVSALALTGCEQEGPMEKAGKEIDNVAEDAGKAAENMMEDAGKALDDATEKVQETMEKQGEDSG